MAGRPGTVRNRRLARRGCDRELVAAGFDPDVALATAVGVDDGVAMLRSDGFVELLAATAHARGRALRLRVLKVNHRAQKFYERLGLRVVGELPRHWSMVLQQSPNRRTRDSSPS